MLILSKRKKTNAAHDIAEYKNFRVLRIASVSISGIVLCGVGVVLYFMYLTIFNTISQVHSIILLSHEYGSHIIDFPLYDQVKKGWGEKSQGIEGTPLPKNIFSGSVLPTSSTPSLLAPKPNAESPVTGINRSL